MGFKSSEQQNLKGGGMRALALEELKWLVFFSQNLTCFCVSKCRALLCCQDGKRLPAGPGLSVVEGQPSSPMPGP